MTAIAGVLAPVAISLGKIDDNGRRECIYAFPTGKDKSFLERVFWQTEHWFT
jgi:hypothetical protein